MSLRRAITIAVEVGVVSLFVAAFVYYEISVPVGQKFPHNPVGCVLMSLIAFGVVVNYAKPIFELLRFWVFLGFAFIFQSGILWLFIWRSQQDYPFVLFGTATVLEIGILTAIVNRFLMIKRDRVPRS